MASANATRLKVLTKFGVSLLIPSIPIGAWYISAINDRKTKIEEVRTKVRVPNIQTIDDLMIEKCQPGDIVLFDRRCHKCAAGPLAAFSCMLGKKILCDENDKNNITNKKIVDIGTFEHVGIVVPGHYVKKSDMLDPSNLLLLEATSSDGIVARPLLQRLEMSQSRSVLLLPLASPGERRNDELYEPTAKTKRLQEHMNKALIKFRDTWVNESKKQNYASAHSTLGIIGSIGYATGLHKTSKAPISPSSFLVVNALMESGAGLNLSERAAFEARVEDFLRDYRFCSGEDVIRLRPGWRFLSPIIMRETSKS
mmetsp:Transcript_27030/g.31448  ORF Transcript_27030/g.31448 Transcript_27030/m.31448 type:complete len:311 (+) Transcript_27030:68-1000(+)